MRTHQTHMYMHTQSTLHHTHTPKYVLHRRVYLGSYLPKFVGKAKDKAQLTYVAKAWKLIRY